MRRCCGFCRLCPDLLHIPAVEIVPQRGIHLLLLVVIDEAFGTRYPLLGRVAANMPFFVFGILLRQNGRLATTVKGRGALLVAACAFVSGSALLVRGNAFVVHDYLAGLVLGLIGTLLVISGSRASPGSRPITPCAGLDEAGYYSMTIYILHARSKGGQDRLFAAGAARGGALLVVALMAVAAGVLAPIVVERQLIRKSPLARRFVLGSQ